MDRKGTGLGASHDEVSSCSYSTNPESTFNTSVSMIVKSNDFQTRPTVHNLYTIRIVKPHFCECCGERLKFNQSVLKCFGCYANLHLSCRNKLPPNCISSKAEDNPCIPSQSSIADFTPQTHPMVPILIQKCIEEIQKRGLTQEGLYSVSGHKNKINELRIKFLSEVEFPDLSNFDIHDIGGCIKQFLLSLKQPLISQSFWNDFVSATAIPSNTLRMREVELVFQLLPLANQDTLAFLLSHLQMVSRSYLVRMSTVKLSKTFASIVFGKCNHEKNKTPGKNYFSEIRKQQLVLNSLLCLPSSFWHNKCIFRNHQINDSGYDASQTHNLPTAENSIDSNTGEIVCSSRLVDPLPLMNFTNTTEKTPPAPKRRHYFSDIADSESPVSGDRKQANNPTPPRDRINAFKRKRFFSDVD